MKQESDDIGFVTILLPLEKALAKNKRAIIPNSYAQVVALVKILQQTMSSIPYYDPEGSKKQKENKLMSFGFDHNKITFNKQNRRVET
jgi:hypothetical protein